MEIVCYSMILNIKIKKKIKMISEKMLIILLESVIINIINIFMLQQIKILEYLIKMEF